MLAVHLENGAVTMRDAARPAAARGLRAAAPAGRRHLQYRSRTAARLLRLRRHSRPRVRRRSGGGGHAATSSASAWPARSTWPARTANGAAAAWDATAPTARCSESSTTRARSQEFFTLPERNLHVLPDDVPTEPRRLPGAAGRRLRDPRPGVDSRGANASPCWATASWAC